MKTLNDSRRTRTGRKEQVRNGTEKRAGETVSTDTRKAFKEGKR